MIAKRLLDPSNSSQKLLYATTELLGQIYASFVKKDWKLTKQKKNTKQNLDVESKPLCL